MAVFRRGLPFACQPPVSLVHGPCGSFALLVFLTQGSELFADLQLQPAWHGPVELRLAHAVGEVAFTGRETVLPENPKSYLGQKPGSCRR